MKSQLLEQCKAYVAEKRTRIEEAIQRIQYSLTSESKSTAGDKHETGRAMLQLEREKLGNQLKEIEQLEAVLQKMNANPSEVISLGSLVVTESLSYYISISAGALKVEGKEVFAISMQSPIGQLLLGKQTWDTYTFRGEAVVVTEVF